MVLGIYHSKTVGLSNKDTATVAQVITVAFSVGYLFIYAIFYFSTNLRNHIESGLVKLEIQNGIKKWKIFFYRYFAFLTVVASEILLMLIMSVCIFQTQVPPVFYLVVYGAYLIPLLFMITILPIFVICSVTLNVAGSASIMTIAGVLFSISNVLGGGIGSIVNDSGDVTSVNMVNTLNEIRLKTEKAMKDDANIKKIIESYSDFGNDLDKSSDLINDSAMFMEAGLLDDYNNDIFEGKADFSNNELYKFYQAIQNDEHLKTINVNWGKLSEDKQNSLISNAVYNKNRQASISNEFSFKNVMKNLKNDLDQNYHGMLNYIDKIFDDYYKDRATSKGNMIFMPGSGTYQYEGAGISVGQTEVMWLTMQIINNNWNYETQNRIYYGQYNETNPTVKMSRNVLIHTALNPFQQLNIISSYANSSYPIFWYDDSSMGGLFKRGLFNDYYSVSYSDKFLNEYNVDDVFEIPTFNMNGLKGKTYEEGSVFKNGSVTYSKKHQTYNYAGILISWLVFGAVWTYLSYFAFTLKLKK
jgi:hypothetical protein